MEFRSDGPLCGSKCMHCSKKTKDNKKQTKKNSKEDFGRRIF